MVKLEENPDTGKAPFPVALHGDEEEMLIVAVSLNREKFVVF